MPNNTESTTLPRIYAWFSAVAAADTDLLAELLAHGVPVDTLHPLRHSTALMEGTRLGRAGLVQWLLDHGASPAFLCGFPLRTPLHCALRWRRWDVANILIQAIADASVIDDYGSTPLHTLCCEPPQARESDIMLGLATQLIRKGAPLDAIDHEGTCALHHCVINDHLGLAALLLRHGANPNVTIPDSGVSPLIIAALEKNKSLAQALLVHGADPHARTHDGSSAIALWPSIATLITRNFAVRGSAAMAEVEV